MTTQQATERRLARIRRVASLMDDQFRIPGTGFRFGVDSLVGLLPVAGDAVATAAGLWLIAEAVRMNVPRRVLMRMLVNLGVDSTLGAVPLVGDLFDVYWKSNRRNADLLEQWLRGTGSHPVPAQPAPKRSPRETP